MRSHQVRCYSKLMKCINSFVPGEVKEAFLEEATFGLNREKVRSHLLEMKVTQMYPRQMNNQKEGTLRTWERRELFQWGINNN